ncbi:hypothetical protein D3C80_2232930 [compost metagenome]
MAFPVPELQVVVGERGIGDPLLQERAVVITELDIFPGRLHTVVHRIRDVDHPIDLAEVR